MATAHIARHPNRDPEVKLGGEQRIVDVAAHSRGDHGRISWVLLNEFAVSLGPGHARSVATSSPHDWKWLSVRELYYQMAVVRSRQPPAVLLGRQRARLFSRLVEIPWSLANWGRLLALRHPVQLPPAASVPRSAIFVSAAIMFAADMEWSTKRANPASAVPQKTTQAIGHAILRRRGSATSGSGLMGPVVLEQSLSVTLSNVGPLGPCCRIAVELRAGVCTGEISGSHCSECARGVPIAARISPTDRPEESSSSIDLIVLSRSLVGRRSFNPSYGRDGPDRSEDCTCGSV